MAVTSRGKSIVANACRSSAGLGHRCWADRGMRPFSNRSPTRTVPLDTDTARPPLENASGLRADEGGRVRHRFRNHSLRQAAARPATGNGADPRRRIRDGHHGDTPRRNERLVPKVRRAPSYMDTIEVTNARFRRFVDATGYVTTAAKKPNWEAMRKHLPPGPPGHPMTESCPGRWYSRLRARPCPPTSPRSGGSGYPVPAGGSPKVRVTPSSDKTITPPSKSPPQYEPLPRTPYSVGYFL
jgi:Sulfatase-modifying factor enzyme 1